MSLFSFLLKNKILLIALFVIPIPIVFLLTNENLHKKTIQTFTNPSSVINQRSGTTAILTTTPSVESPQDRMQDKFENRVPLSEADQAAKNEIVSLLPSKSGIVYQSADVTIEYIASVDAFQGEIVSTNITSAKHKVSLWFKLHGMSQEGICNAPLTFYLNFEIKNQLKSEADSFNPLPEGC